MATQNSKRFHHNESLVFLYAENTSEEDGQYTLASPIMCSNLKGMAEM